MVQPSKTGLLWSTQPAHGLRQAREPRFKITVNKPHQSSFVPSGGSSRSNTVPKLRQILSRTVPSNVLEDIVTNPEAVAELAPIALIAGDDKFNKYHVDLIVKNRGQDVEIYVSISLTALIDLGSPERPRRKEFKSIVYTTRINAAELSQEKAIPPKPIKPKKRIAKKLNNKYLAEKLPPPPPEKSTYTPPPEVKPLDLEEVKRQYQWGDYVTGPGPKYREPTCTSVADPNCRKNAGHSPLINELANEASDPFIMLKRFAGSAPCKGGCIPEPRCNTPEGRHELSMQGYVCVPCVSNQGSAWLTSPDVD